MDERHMPLNIGEGGLVTFGVASNNKSKRHSSDCALHNAPAFEPKPCDCGAETNEAGAVAKTPGIT